MATVVEGTDPSLSALCPFPSLQHAGEAPLASGAVPALCQNLRGFLAHSKQKLTDGPAIADRPHGTGPLSYGLSHPLPARSAPATPTGFYSGGTQPPSGPASPGAPPDLTDEEADGPQVT